MGIAHWKVSDGYGLLQLLVGVSLLAVNDYGLTPVSAILGICFGTFTIAGGYIRKCAAQRVKTGEQKFAQDD